MFRLALSRELFPFHIHRKVSRKFQLYVLYMLHFQQLCSQGHKHASRLKLFLCPVYLLYLGGGNVEDFAKNFSWNFSRFIRSFNDLFAQTDNNLRHNGLGAEESAQQASFRFASWFCATSCGNSRLWHFWTTSNTFRDRKEMFALKKDGNDKLVNWILAKAIQDDFYLYAFVCAATSTSKPWKPWNKQCKRKAEHLEFKVSIHYDDISTWGIATWWWRGFNGKPLILSVEALKRTRWRFVSQQRNQWVWLMRISLKDRVSVALKWNFVPFIFALHLIVQQKFNKTTKKVSQKPLVTFFMSFSPEW